MALRKGLNFEGWREDDISSLTLAEVAFLQVVPVVRLFLRG